MSEAAAVAIGLFLAGVIFHSGYLAARVAHLEEWRLEVRKNFDGLFELLRRIEDRIAERED